MRYIIANFISFLDRYNLPWLLLAIISWIIIYFTSKHKSFFRAFPMGIWTAVVGYLLERFFIAHKFWTERFIMININDIDLFVVIGPFFSLGILLIQYLPETAMKQLASVLLWSCFATAIELLAIKLGFLSYMEGKWSYLHSLLAYFLCLMNALGFYHTLQSSKKYKLF